MPIQTPQTTTGTPGQTLFTTNLHFLDLFAVTKTGFPTLDSTFKLIHTTPTDVAKLTDWTEANEQDGYLMGMLIMCYLCDIWTETANRFAPPVDGATGTVVGLMNEVLSQLA